MNWWDSHLNLARVLITTALLFFLILTAYFNTFDAAWQFDDKPNILNNKYIHIENLKPESLIQTFYTQPTTPAQLGKSLNRPISFLTLALNWYSGKDRVRGYHVINFLIHFLTSVFLMITFLNLLNAPNLKKPFHRGRYSIAFLSAVLWALNPIQTQAVTYIVQRMASLAAMFYILSMLCYIKCRLSHLSSHRIFYLLSATISFLLALGSKENAVMLPTSLLLIEVACFQDFNRQYSKRNWLRGVTVAGIICLFCGIWFLNSDNTFSFLNGYQSRPFTLIERLLTEPRILLIYLSQIFLPLPSRLSVEHDVTLSISLFQPWTTLPAILLVLLLIGLGLSQIRRRPIIALPILFFFLNHIIESTVIPLELFFEHRNYLPSMFLFLPIACGFRWLYDYCSLDQIHLKRVLTGLVVLLIGCLGTATHARNQVWATELSLWQDAMQKAPQSARPLTNVAWQMTYGSVADANQYDEALELYQKALLLQAPKTFSKSIILNNMASIYFKQDESQKAIDVLQNALIISPDYARGRYHLAKILMVNGQWNEALEHIENLLAKDHSHEKYLSLKGSVLLHQQQYDRAIEYLQESLKNNPLFKESLMHLGMAYSSLGNYSRAEAYLIRAHQVHPKNMIPLLGLIENRLMAEDSMGSQKYIDILNHTYSPAAIKIQLKELKNNHLSLFLSTESSVPMIENQWAYHSAVSF